VNSILLTVLTLVVALSGVVFGCYLRGRLPSDHLVADSRDFVKIALGLLTTMAALLLSLQLSSAKTSFDMQETQITQVSAEIVLLDRALSRAGGGSDAARRTLRDLTAGLIARTWPDRHSWARPEPPPGSERLYEEIAGIRPGDDSERLAKSDAVTQMFELARLMRNVTQEQGNSTALPLLAVEISWVGIIFVSFGLLAPRNATTLTALVLCAGALAIAIFLIVEMSTPFSGFITISDTSLQSALQAIAPAR
jgi:hypothetical protein